MTYDELNKNSRVQFMLNGKLVQGLIIGDKHKKVVVMQNKGNNNWEPLFIPIHLLEHIEFRHAIKLFMPIYNPIMEGILNKARKGQTDGW